jgi:prolipoprotein diacylglyceryltransferase
MLPILNIGPLAIQVPGLFLLAGVWVGVSLMEKEAPRLKLNASILSNMVLVGLVAGILGARVSYAIRFLDVYLDNPISLLSLNPTTLSPVEGGFIGLAVAATYGRKRGLALWRTLDALTPGLAAFFIAIGFSHLASGDAFGAATKLPWAIELWGAERHPSQIYEVLTAGLILFAVLEMRGRGLAPGGLFAFWAGLAALSRLFLEGFRGDSVVVLGVLRSAQVGSLLVLSAALLVLHLRQRAARA